MTFNIIKALTTLPLGMLSDRIGRRRVILMEWVTAILGLAVIAAPFVGLAGDAFTWSLVILGALVAVVGFWSATENTSTYRSTSRLQHQ
jgi:MFS family permease